MTTQVKPPPPAIAAATPPPAIAAATPTATPAAAAPPVVARKARKFTVAEYFRMAEKGILDEQERVELIDGEVLLMPPMGPRHIGGVARYARIFILRAGNRFTVLTQSTVRLNEHLALEPDVVLLRFREDDYSLAHAIPADMLLVVEVADSSLAYDREVKAHIYGRAGVPETWVLNLPEDCIERFTAPGPQGYARHEILRRGDKVSPVSLPDMELAVDELLPPAAAGE